MMIQTGAAIDHLFTSVSLVVVELPLNPGLQKIVTFSWKYILLRKRQNQYPNVLYIYHYPQ